VHDVLANATSFVTVLKRLAEYESETSGQAARALAKAAAAKNPATKRQRDARQRENPWLIRPL
jgi:hypothetical protein